MLHIHFNIDLSNGNFIKYSFLVAMQNYVELKVALRANPNAKAL